jgi:hypothetical protein
MVQELPGVEHGSAADADRPAPRPLVEAVREDDSPFDQPVQIRRMHLGVVQGMEARKRLVIRKEEQEVRSLAGSCAKAGAKQARKRPHAHVLQETAA